MARYKFYIVLYCIVFYDFLGFVVLKSPEICFCHLNGNPVCVTVMV